MEIKKIDMSRKSSDSRILSMLIQCEFKVSYICNMYSSYVIYELLIRLQALDPAVGDYVSFKKINAGISVQTTTGPLEIPNTLLDLQFHNPAGINNMDLLQVLSSLR